MSILATEVKRPPQNVRKISSDPQNIFLYQIRLKFFENLPKTFPTYLPSVQEKLDPRMRALEGWIDAGGGIE